MGKFLFQISQKYWKPAKKIFGNEFHSKQKDTRQIIKDALKTLGLNEAFLKVEMGLRPNQKVKWDIENLTTNEWVKICQILHLDFDFLILGYDKNCHKRMIVHAIEKDSFQLPMNDSVQRIISEVVPRYNSYSINFEPTALNPY